MPSPAPAAPDEALAWLPPILSMQSQQLQHLTELMATLVDQKRMSSPPTLPMPVADPYGDLMQDLPAFNYDEDDDATFDAWIKRYGPLDRAAYKTYSEHVLPLKPRDIDLPTTLLNLTKLFGPKKTLTCRRFEFLQSTCPALSGSYVPYREFGNTIKKKFEEASVKDVDSETLKCLVFISGLTDSSHSEMRLRLLNRINRLSEGDPSPTLDDFINDCETFVTLRSDNRAMETEEIKAAYQKKTGRKKKSYSSRERHHRSRSNVRQRHTSHRSQKSESPPRKPRKK
ncbi:hypothetical protein ANCCAN_26135, partial [Ancylostoma caninum]